MHHISVHQVTDANRYSSWKKLLRITAYVLRFVRRMKVEGSLELDSEEVQHAEQLWIKSIQYQSFPEVWNTFQMTHPLRTLAGPLYTSEKDEKAEEMPLQELFI